MKVKMLAGELNCEQRMTKSETTKLELSKTNRDKRLKIRDDNPGNLSIIDTSYNVYISRIPEGKKEVCVWLEKQQKKELKLPNSVKGIN